jgi:hypothetical protein
MKRDEVNQDPVEGEFFAPEEGYAAALVREAIQNMLDNRAGTDPVRARFSFGHLTKANETLETSSYLKDLQSHLQALRVPYRPQSSDQIDFLVVEDSGTRGLCGNETHYSDTQHDEGEPKNDFFYFWRNVGRSKKSTTDRGRWGLGKTVFPASSRVLAFFGLTRRSSDKRELLMGQFVGKIHEIDEVKYAPYGYFGRIEEDGFALPIEQPEAVHEFMTTFGLKRAEEPGLSVVVPFPHKELTAQAILQEVIRNYYLPILSGDLVVEIDSGNDDAVIINEETVVGLAGTLGGEIQQMIDFASDALTVPESERVNLGMTPAGEAPTWGADSIFGQVDLDGLRKRFDEGKLLALRIPVNVGNSETGVVATSYFDAYLTRDPHLERGRGEFVRQGLTISKIDRPPKGGIRGLVIVNDAPLSALLGDSEGPAHTKWEERRDRVKKYQHGSFTVRYVSRALRDLSEVLAQQAAGIDEEALLDLFFLPDSEQSESQQKDRVIGKRGKKVTPPIVVPPIERRARTYDIRQVKGGFLVHGTADDDEVPHGIRVEVAYMTENGSSLNSYHPFDFDLSKAPISISASGATFRASENVLELAPDSPKFTVEVRGFDGHRDLVVAGRP